MHSHVDQLASCARGMRRAFVAQLALVLVLGAHIVVGDAPAGPSYAGGIAGLRP